MTVKTVHHLIVPGRKDGQQESVLPNRIIELPVELAQELIKKGAVAALEIAASEAATLPTKEDKPKKTKALSAPSDASSD